MATIIEHQLNFESLLAEGIHPEVVLAVEGKEFPVHRIILAAQSEFFKKLLYKKQQAGEPAETFKIHARLAPFELVLKYLYSGSLESDGKHIEMMWDILELSRVFGLTKLEKSLTENVISIKTTENLHLAIKTAVMFQSEDLKLKCCKVLNETNHAFFKLETFLGLSESELTSILFSDKLEMTTINKFQTAATWLKANPDKKTILELIDLSRLSNNQIIQIIGPTGLFSGDSLMQLMAERKVDVAEEVEMDVVSIEDPQFKKATVVLGVNPQNIFSKSDFVSAIRINNEREVILDLEEVCEINCIKFDLGDKIQDYSIFLGNEFASDSIPERFNWTLIQTYRHCKVEQTIYFEKAACRFIRLQNVTKFRSFRALNLTDLPSNLVDFYVCPNENIFNDSTAYVVADDIKGSFKFSSKVNEWNFQDTELQTSFISFEDFVEFRLNQPHYLQKLRFRLWDFDNSTYSFDLIAIDVQGDEIELKEYRSSNGWIVMNISAAAYSGFQFLNRNEEKTAIKIAYFEANY